MELDPPILCINRNEIWSSIIECEPSFMWRVFCWYYGIQSQKAFWDQYNYAALSFVLFLEVQDELEL